MKIRRGKVITITSYVISIIIYLIIAISLYTSLIQLHYLYLFITIPLLFLFFSLIIFTFIKIFLMAISLMFDKNENDDIELSIMKRLNDTNRIFKYVLIGIFIALLTSVMILHIAFCISKGRIEFTAISIVIWVLLYYLIFIKIVKMIKKEIRL